MNAPAAALLDELAAGGLSTAAPPPPDLVPPLAADLPAPPAGLLGLWFATWAGGRTLVHVARGENRMRQAARAARAFAPAGLEVLVLPPWDCLPYDRASPSRAVMGERMATLRRLTLPRPPAGRVVLTTADALAQRVPPRTAVKDAAYRIAAGDNLDIGAFRLFLLRAGYVLDERVDEAGEAVVRGGVLDLFPAAAEGPYRLELDGERVTAIRAYDPLSQRGVAEVDALVLEPASEALLPSDALARRLARAARGPDEAAAADPSEQTLLALFVPDLPEPAARLPGAEHRLALLYGTPETPFDYLPADGTGIVLDPEVEARRQAFAESVRDAHAARLALRRSEQLAGTAEVLLEPERLYLTDEEWAERLADTGALTFSQPSSPDDRRLPELARAANAGAALRALVRQRLDAGDRVALAATDERERRRLARLATRGSSTTEIAAPGGWAEFLALAPGSLATLPLDLPGGFVAGGSAVVAADDLAGRRPAATSRPAVAAGGGGGMLLTADLRLDDHVVHVDHGVGLLRGLETVAEQEDATSEYLALEYAGGSRKLVPVLEMDGVWRYGSEEAGVPLDRLEGDAWQARRERVEAEIAASAEALAKLARERAGREAPALKPRPRDYARFVGRFPYPETDDQAQAIEATLADLARGSPPMDRLVCGDVGFGKTEVALRAAAVAAMAGRQVAVLAPTTILVRQHLDTFRQRFAGFGVRVEQLSRLAGAKEARAVRDGLADGSVRVVVGTHALASPGVRFADLGLVVIDEEQRFGARHKAALRRLRDEGSAHVLTMTATPIPRTTQAALAGLQGLSVIATPPVRRQPVRTFVLPFDGALVREALLRECRRGGRSFVVVPRVADLDPIAERLAALVPELDTAAAHGRMRAEEMDDVVLAFAQGRHDVLLATSIIETGLDIPGADTMVVWRPDRFGIAQLHQLRGRVGRGRERAVCYLLSDPESPLPPATERRLKTLEALEGLGAGFAVAARDLDLRGAGDLLGEEQAGHVRLIGTGLYQHLLERALRRARGEPVPDEWSPELNLGVGVAIPEEYVPEPEVRLDLYARLARLGSMAEVDDLADEIADRFGPPPDAVRHMLAVAAVRRRCQRAGIAKVDVGPKAAAAAFRDLAAAERQFGGAVEGSGGVLRLKGERLIMAREGGSEDERLAAAEELLDRLERA